MRSIPLALNTLREAIRDKILYVILLFAFVLIASGVLLTSLSLNQENKIVMDLGLSSISIFGLIRLLRGFNVMLHAPGNLSASKRSIARSNTRSWSWSWSWA